MRLPGLLLLLIACIVTSGCVGTLESQQPAPKFTTGFWFWAGSSPFVLLHSKETDVVFFNASTVETPSPMNVRQSAIYAEIPDRLPAAREYWAVFRVGGQRLPDIRMAHMISDATDRLVGDARDKDLHLAGIQLDIDSPTNSLAQYAAFLREVRKGLPKGLQISVTALLDWFRDGTSVSEVVREVDEFVPQFYDVDYNSMSRGAIAAKFDAAHWGPILNRYDKRFRIGISTFGRARVVRASNPSPFYRDLVPMDVAGNPDFSLQTARNEAGETVLSYRASRKVRIGYSDIGPGDTVQFVLPTPEEIHAAVDGARSVHGYCAGVVFFRWPSDNESLTMQPDEVMEATGVAVQKTPPGIRQIDGKCAAVKCVDLYLTNGTVLSPKYLRYRIRASTELEYFLPDPGSKIPVRMTGPAELELSLPPWCGRDRMLLGRAVTSNAASFTVETE
jgi:hypothetical protein